MACVYGKRGQVLLLCGLKCCPHEVMSGKSCWRIGAPRVQLFRRGHSENWARRMLSVSLHLANSRGIKQDQGPRCMRTEAGFGFDLGSHRNVKQHLACGLGACRCARARSSLRILRHTGCVCVCCDGVFHCSLCKTWLSIPRPWTISILWHHNISASANFLVFFPWNWRVEICAEYINIHWVIEQIFSVFPEGS